MKRKQTFNQEMLYRKTQTQKSISCNIYLQLPQISKAKYILNIFFAGLELLSYLGGKPSTVITAMCPQRALSVYQSQDPAEDGADHHCMLLGAMQRQCAHWRSAKGDCGDPNAISELKKAPQMGDSKSQRDTQLH